MTGLGTRNGDAQELEGPRELLTLDVRGDQSPGLSIILESYSVSWAAGGIEETK